jgi:predicted O-methyltransferase YrrM
MVTLLDTWILPSDRGIEWGSGRSTVWFAKKAQSLVSIEHHPDWFEKVRCKLTAARCSNVDYRLMTDVFEYVNTGGGPFDFALVDGIERDTCALRATDLLSRGGVLIVDNVNWFLPPPTHTRSPATVTAPATDKWAKFLGAVNGWRSVWTSNGVTDTAMWVKP